MSRKDRPIIYKDLRQSPFTLEMEGITFHFSSQLHLIKYVERLGPFTNEMHERLYNRYCIRIYCPIWSAIALYNQIETRGFLIKNRKGEYIESCLMLKLDGNPENVSR